MHTVVQTFYAIFPEAIGSETRKSEYNYSVSYLMDEESTRFGKVIKNISPTYIILFLRMES